MLCILILISASSAAFAAGAGDLEFTLDGSGSGYYVSDCKSTAKGDITIPSTYNGLPVVGIGSKAFYLCYDITGVSLPDSITYISSYAFYCCAITGMVIPEGVSAIEDYTFYYCDKLKSVQLPDSVTSLGRWAFGYCKKLESINLPAGVGFVSSDAFNYCNSLKAITVSSGNASLSSVDGVLFNKNKTELLRCPGGKEGAYAIPASVTSVADSAFYYCIGLTSITIPSSVGSIGEKSFYYCASLAELTVPGSIKEIPASAFQNCISLTSLTVENGVEVIGASAFEECLSLVDISLPGSLKRIKGFAFCSTARFTYLDYWDGELLYIGDCLITSLEESIEAADIKDGTRLIADYAFSHCLYLASVNIPKSVKIIGDGAFCCCENLGSINIPDTVTNVGSGLFSESPNTKITVRCSAPAYKTLYEEYPGQCVSSHSFGSWIIDSEPDCTKGGFCHRVCKGCGLKENETIEPRGHILDDWTVVKKATCTESGTEALICTVCGKTIDEEIIPASGKHNYGAWVTDKKATSSAAGKRHKTCADCGVTVTETVPRLAPGKTTLSKIQNTAKGVKITWKAVSGADNFYIYRKAGSETKWTKIKNVKGNVLTYTDTAVKSGTNYTYTVKAANPSGSGSYDKTGLTVKYLAEPVVSLSNGNGRITVKWGKISGAKGYYVYRKAGSETKWTKIASIKDANTLSYTDKNVKSGTKYTYTVKAYNGTAVSSYCSGICIKYLAAAKLISASSTKTGIVLKWGKISGASGYYVYRKTGSGSWSKIAAVKKNTAVTYTDKTAKKGTAYTYCVRAYSSSDKGAYANTLSCKDKY